MSSVFNKRNIYLVTLNIYLNYINIRPTWKLKCKILLTICIKKASKTVIEFLKSHFVWLNQVVCKNWGREIMTKWNYTKVIFLSELYYKQTSVLTSLLVSSVPVFKKDFNVFRLIFNEKTTSYASNKPWKREIKELNIITLSILDCFHL